MADSLSRQASANKYTGPDPVLGITPPTVHSELQHWACREAMSTSNEMLYL